ncbi:FluG domain-containing protein, partial [Metarhizium majus ARSEF 297]
MATIEAMLIVWNSVRDQGMRHRPNSTIYQEAYHNAKSNAVVQDAFLGRGTASPYLTNFNHMGFRRDENAPKVVSDDLMRSVGPSRAPRTARQKHRRKIHKMIYKDHFDAKDEEELQKQSQGIRESEVKL